MSACRYPPSAIVTTDVGQHPMWVAHTYPFSEPRTLLTSGGLGTMGFGLPAAIGAAHLLSVSLCFAPEDKPALSDPEH